MYHPVSNDVVETANRKNFKVVYKRLQDDTKGKWLDQLTKVIWGLNTTETRCTCFMLFKLMYGTEAMTPQELKFKSPRVENSLASETNESVGIDKYIMHIKCINNMSHYYMSAKQHKVTD